MCFIMSFLKLKTYFILYILWGCLEKKLNKSEFVDQLIKHLPEFTVQDGATQFFVLMLMKYRETFACLFKI